jgi:hypothetical protein
MDPNEKQSPADLLREMNEEYTQNRNDLTQPPAPGATPPAATTEQPATPTPGTPPPAATTPAGKQTKPAPGTLPAKTNELPPDPSFVRKTDEPTETPAPAAGTPPETGTPPAEQAVPDELFYSRLSALTDGGLKQESDLVRLVNHYNELLDKEEKGFEPKFPNERAKMAYRMMQANPGKELETALRTARALQLGDQVDKLVPKELLFEAYRMKPENSDITNDPKVREYFEAEYADKFSDLENNLVQQRKHANEVREAKESIATMQKGWEAAEAPAQAISKEVVAALTNSVENFGGIRLAFSDNPQENEYLNIPVTDENEKRRLLDNALNPDKWFQQFFKSFEGPQGYDYQGLARTMYMIDHLDELQQQAFDHGTRIENIRRIAKERNSSTPTDISRPGGTPPAPVQTNESFLGNWEKAQKAQEGRAA